MNGEIMQVEAPSYVYVSFLGAAGTVTGSRHLLAVNGSRYLIDCGLFQGPRELEDLNWKSPSVNPSEFTAILLTHAHIDHSGFLPRFVREGFRGPIYATEATCALLHIMLRDAAHLQEQDAEYANRKGYSRHKPALPLYTIDDAEQTLRLLKPITMHEAKSLEDLNVIFRPTGHLLGAAALEFYIGAHSRRPVVFSGDLGRYNSAIMKSPWAISEAEFLVIESTYGNRLHKDENVEIILPDLLNKVVKARSTLLIPAFAVGRAQQVLYHIRRLQEKGRAPKLPVYIDSPMANSATDIYCRFGDEHNLSVNLLMDHHQCPLMCEETHFVRTVEESKSLNARTGPMVIIAASGMCTGGRILHHLKSRLPNPENFVLFVGYQAQGSRGRALLDGAKEVTIHGEAVSVNAQIVSVDALSTHPDQAELLKWLSNFNGPPKRTFVVHGEKEASEGLKAAITEQLGWDVVVPSIGQRYSLQWD